MHTSTLDRALRFPMTTAAIPWEGICVPPESPHTPWSLKDLYTQEDTTRDHGARSLAVRVGAVLNELEVVRARAPSVATSSGDIVDPLDLTDEILLPQAIRLYRNKDLPSDGTVLRKKGDAFVMSGGGCPVIVLTGRSSIVVAHASRDSLLPRSFTEDGAPTEPHVSVVAQSVRKMKELEPDLSITAVDFRVIFGIPAKEFPHPANEGKHAANNRGRTRYIERTYGQNFVIDPAGQGYLDLNAITARQARDCGLTLIGHGCTLKSKGRYAYTRHPKQELAQGRNLVIVRRLA